MWYHVFFRTKIKFLKGLKQEHTKEDKTHKGKRITWQKQPNHFRPKFQINDTHPGSTTVI